jgi:hypothetical protein
VFKGPVEVQNRNQNDDENLPHLAFELRAVTRVEIRTSPYCRSRKIFVPWNGIFASWLVPQGFHQQSLEPGRCYGGARKTLADTVQNSVQDCMRTMTESHIRHLPVIENEKVLGVVSIGDLVKWIISAQEETIHHLERYIT